MTETVQASEWAKLKLVGRPVMTSRDLWVAVRPLPRLVHVYYDSSLRALLLFPEDPIFLLFASSREDTCDKEHIRVTMSEPGFACLLVITSDGSLWWISDISSYESTGRPFKRLRKFNAREQTVKGTEDEWDIFEDCDIYNDTDLYPADDSSAGPELECTGSVKAHILCKLLNSRASENAFRKVRARCVRPETFVGKFLGACCAAAGPDDLIAVASKSRSPSLWTGASLSSRDCSPAQGTCTSNDCQTNRKTIPSCLLFATVNNSKHRSQREAVTLSPKLFALLSQGFIGARPKHILLQGDSAGKVQMFPIDNSNQTSSSVLLCDLQEPISGLIAFPFFEDSDALLVLSSYGCVIAITASKSVCTSTPFLTPFSEFSLWKLFRVDLKDGFDIHSWRVKAPVISATLYGSEHLCFRSASTVCIVSITENVGNEPGQELSHAASTSSISKEEVRKKSLICRTIPIHDILVLLAGQGPFVPREKSRFLIGLTSRGRLVAIKILGDIFAVAPDCMTLKDNVKSWKPIVQNQDENTMDGEELSGTDVHGDTMRLMLDNKQLRRELQISAPTLLLGCMVREAVLWRLKQLFGSSQPASRGSTDQVLALLKGIQTELDIVMQNAENIDRRWRANHLEQSDFACSLVDEACGIFRRILEMYVNYRENDASNPFQSCLHAQSV